MSPAFDASARSAVMGIVELPVHKGPNPADAANEHAHQRNFCCQKKTLRFWLVFRESFIIKYSVPCVGQQCLLICVWIRFASNPNSPAPQSPLLVNSVGTCTAVFLSALELTSVATALPTIVHDLNGTDFVWVGNAYALSCAAVMPAGGCLSNAFGRQPVMLGFIALFATGAVVAGAAQSMEVLIAGRGTCAQHTVIQLGITTYCLYEFRCSR